MIQEEWTALRRISLKLALLGSPILLLCICELLVFPEDLFTFRVWEATIINGRNVLLTGSFYPNRDFDRLEQGDLVPYTADAVTRPVTWQIDANGFRNSPSKCANYPMVIVGDSFAVGTSLTQVDTLSEQLSRRLDTCVYSYSSLELNDYLQSKLWRHSKPATVLYVKAEWWLLKQKDLPGKAIQLPGTELEEYLNLQSFGFHESKWLQNLAILRDRYGKSIMLNAFRTRGPLFVITQIGTWLFSGRSDSRMPNADLTVKPMHFREGKLQQVAPAREEIERIVRRIIAFRNEFARHGVRFVFMPVPSKETIYLQGLQHRGDLLNALYQRLDEEKVETVELLPAFQKSNQNFLYQTDDTHWNSTGVKLSVDAIEAFLKHPL